MTSRPILEPVALTSRSDLERRILRMLREAPGYSRDIAAAIGAPLDGVNAALENLCAGGRAKAHSDDFDNWYSAAKLG